MINYIESIGFYFIISGTLQTRNFYAALFVHHGAPSVDFSL